jgi:hypothetical protein
METSTGAVTVSVVLPEIPPEVALIVAEPVATVEANPALLIVAMDVEEELHVGEVKTFWLPSE